MLAHCGSCFHHALRCFGGVPVSLKKALVSNKHHFREMSQNGCTACGNVVHLVERASINNAVFHTRCVRCSTCQNRLPAAQARLIGTRLYCRFHVPSSKALDVLAERSESMPTSLPPVQSQSEPVAIAVQRSSPSLSAADDARSAAPPNTVGVSDRQRRMLPSSSLAAAALAENSLPSSLPSSSKPSDNVATTRAAFAARMESLATVLHPSLLSDIQAHVAALEAALATSATLVEAVLASGDKVSEEQRTELERFANVAADRIVREESATLRWKARASRLRQRSESQKCVVCLDRPRNVVLLPCSHLALCNECCARMSDSTDCPVCRAAVAQIHVVHVP